MVERSKVFVDYIWLVKQRCFTTLTMCWILMSPDCACCLNLQWVEQSRGPGYFPKFLMGVCSTFLENLTLFQTKIFDYQYPMSDQTERSMLGYFRPLKSVHVSNKWPQLTGNGFHSRWTRDKFTVIRKSVSTKQHTQLQASIQVFKYSGDVRHILLFLLFLFLFVFNFFFWPFFFLW